MVLASDTIVQVCNLVVVFSIDAKVKHVVLHLPDLGDGKPVFADVSRLEHEDERPCTRCSLTGHRSDVCTRQGVQMTEKLIRARKRLRGKQRHVAS